MTQTETQKVFTALLSVLLAGCFGIKPFQPSPPEYETWVKPDTSIENVKLAMLNCGYPNIFGGDRDTSSNASAAMFVCMRKAGFKRKSGFEYCQLRKDLPACAEYNQGYPLSVEQLEQLPYREDLAFDKLSPNDNPDPINLVTWRKQGSSLHFKVRPDNDRATLQTMYECGYPNPLGKGATVTIKKAAEIHSCMEKKGYIGQAPSIQPHVRLISVCEDHPKLLPCHKRSSTNQ